MPSNILYSFDESAHVQEILPRINSNHKIYLCPLTSHQQFITDVEDRCKGARPSSVERIACVEKFNAKAFAAKESFLEFISTFAEQKRFDEKNLKEYLRCPFASFSFWWLSLVAEKNPLKSNSYTNLAKLLTILDAVQDADVSELWLQIKNPELVLALRGNLRRKIVVREFSQRPWVFRDWFYGLMHFVKGLWRFVVLALKSFYIRLSTKRRQDLRKSRYLLVTYFPFMDEEKLKEGTFVDKFYGPLQRALEKKYPGQISWLAMTVDTERYKFRESMAMGRDINRRQGHLFFLEEMIGGKGLALMLPQYLWGVMKFILAKGAIKKHFRFGAEQVFIWPLFRKEFYSSFGGTRLMGGLFYYHCFFNLCQKCSAGTRLLYLAEMQDWEKALNIAARTAGKVTTVGLQHAMVSVLHLMYFNHPEDLKAGNCVDKMPQPHYLATIGKTAAGLFKKSGWGDNVFILGPFRFEHIQKILQRRISWREKENRVVVALPFSPNEAREVLFYVAQAFKKAEGYDVIIKEHPFCPVKKLLRSMKNPIPLKGFQLSDASLEELLNKAKVLIVTESSVALWGVACQCRLVVPRLTGTVDLNPLSGVSELPVFVHHPAQLKSAVESAIRGELAGYGEQCNKFFADYCDFPKTDDEWLGRLESAIQQPGSKEYAHVV